MNRKTNKLIVIIAAFIINVCVYIGILWIANILVFRNSNLEPTYGFILSILIGMVGYSVYVKIKPFSISEMLKKYSEEL